MIDHFKFLFLVLGFISLLACEKVTPKAKMTSGGGEALQKLEQPALKYRMDEKGGLFQNLKWYEYDMLTHIVWPLRDVYAIKTPSRTYLLQVQSYYSTDAQEAGRFVIAVKSGADRVTYEIDGTGCGNPFTNPDFTACQANPAQNIFSYLDLDTGHVWKMTEAESVLDADWDLGVRATELVLNSGPRRKGLVRGALALRFSFFFGEDGKPSLSNLRQLSLQAEAHRGFESLQQRDRYDFYQPEGIDRVLHESYWMREDVGGLRSASNQNTWIIQGQSKKFFAKMWVPLVEDVALADGFESKVRFRYVSQDEDDARFGADESEIVVSLSTAQRLKSFCLRLQTSEVLDCSLSEGRWDLKFTAIHRKQSGVWSREWLVFTAAGAIGPLTAAEAATWDSGRLE